MDIIAVPLLNIVYMVIQTYSWVVIVYVILNWLISFQVVNLYNNFVRVLYDMCYRLVEPALAQLRRFLPKLGGVDLSPFALILVLYFLQMVIIRILVRLTV